MEWQKARLVAIVLGVTGLSASGWVGGGRSVAAADLAQAASATQAPDPEPDLSALRPIAAFDSVWIEEMTWMEVRDAIKDGKTTAIIAAGSTEQNGPYVPTGKHNFILRLVAEAIARQLGDALVAPIVPFESGPWSSVTPGTFQVRPETFQAWVNDEANSLKANGFHHIVLLGDSGGDQEGLDAVAKVLSNEWVSTGTTIHFVREYYDSWQDTDGALDSLGVPKAVDEGIHDDYSVNSILSVLDPEKIRFKERVAAGKASINGQTLLPLDRTIANGRKLISIRANITVNAIKKALANK